MHHLFMQTCDCRIQSYSIPPTNQRSNPIWFDAAYYACIPVYLLLGGWRSGCMQLSAGLCFVSSLFQSSTKLDSNPPEMSSKGFYYTSTSMQSNPPTNPTYNLFTRRRSIQLFKGCYFALPQLSRYIHTKGHVKLTQPVSMHSCFSAPTISAQPWLTGMETNNEQDLSCTLTKAKTQLISWFAVKNRGSNRLL